MVWFLVLITPGRADCQNQVVHGDGDARARTPYSAVRSILNDAELLSEAERGLSRLYNMEYEAADSVFKIIDSQYPGHPIGPFLRALVLWWRILPELQSGAEAADDAFYESMGDVIKRSDKMLDRDKADFDAMFFKGAALGFRGRLRSNRQLWLSAAKDGKKALEYIFDIAAADTTNADFQFGAGVYNYFAATIPTRYPIVKPMLIFFPDADRATGLKNLQFTAEHGRLIRTEAVYFLLQIFLLYEPNFEKAVRYASWLTARYPDNAYFRLLEGRVYVRWGQGTRAMISFDSVIGGNEEKHPGYTDALAAVAWYYQGRYHMQGRRLEPAAVAFQRVEELSQAHKKDSFYRVNAMLRQGMIHDLVGERDEALATYKIVLKMDDLAEAHKRAKRYRKEPYSIQ